MEIKSELKYTKDHEWVKVEGNQATIGITDYAQGELGDIVYIEVEALGENLQKEEIFGSVEDHVLQKVGQASLIIIFHQGASCNVKTNRKFSRGVRVWIDDIFKAIIH